jgi:hypothetical protein
MTTKLTAVANRVFSDPTPRAKRRWPGACSALVRMLRPLALATLLCGCTTPSVPLPPPELMSLTFTGTTPGIVQIIGKPADRHADARFYVYDYDSGEGVITKAAGDGSFTSMPFAGNDGDQVQIYFDNRDGDRSQELCTTLQRDVGLLSTRCPVTP